MTEQSKEAMVEQAKQVKEELLTVMETLGNNMCDVIERTEALREENESLLREADENAALAMQRKMRADDLAKENAELKARLEKAVELPVKVGEYRFDILPWLMNVKKSVIDTTAKLEVPMYLYIKCETPEIAEAKLAELEEKVNEETDKP